MKRLRTNNKTGLTLIEVMVAMVILMVAGLGALAFRYYCSLDARKADIQITAARIGTMLLESWIGQGGSTSYNPVTQLTAQLKSTDPASSVDGGVTGPEPQGGLSRTGSNNDYKIVVNGVNYYVTLSTNTAVSPVPLSVSVAWRHDYQAGSISASDKCVNLTTLK